MTEIIKESTSWYLERITGSQQWKEHISELLAVYLNSGLAPPHLQQEIETRSEQKIMAYAWEAMLYHHFRNLGFQFRTDHLHKSGQDGPDIGIICARHTIWIEAVVPEPKDIPPEWVNQTPPMVMSMPEEQMLLRWTSALRDKNENLKKRLQTGVVQSDESYVVAINSCMLSWFPKPEVGITGWPLVVEAVFPVSIPGIQVNDKDEWKEIHRPRYIIEKHKNKAQVRTDNFLDHEYSGISALIGCSQNESINGSLSFEIVHNPLACNPLPTGLLGAKDEYVAKCEGEEYHLTRI